MSGPDLRLAGLRRFAISISVLNLLGHTVLGFESSWSQMFVALITAYFTEIVLEVVDAWANKRPYRFAGGVWKLIDFLLPAHIAGMAVAMLLYPGSLLLPFVFASAVGHRLEGVIHCTGKWVPTPFPQPLEHRDRWLPFCSSRRWRRSCRTNLPSISRAD